MRIQLDAVMFDREVKGPGSRADGETSHKAVSVFAVGQDRYPITLHYDTDRDAVVITHKTAKERRVVLVPWSRVVGADESEMAELAKK